MKYLPDLFVIGLAITLLSVLLGIILFVFEKKLRIKEPAVSSTAESQEGEYNFEIAEENPENTCAAEPADTEAGPGTPEIDESRESVISATRATCRKYRATSRSNPKYRKYSGRR